MLLGLAVGDAIGSSLEFGPRISPPLARREMTGGGPFDLPVGCWTDDTALANALSKSLLVCRKWDPLDAAQRFLAYYREGQYSSVPGTCVDIGVTTRQALERFERTGNAYSGSTDEHSSGNGSIMRLAPVAIFTLDAPEAEAVRIARDQSRLTHGSDVCLDSCSYLVQLLRLILRGESDPLKLAMPQFEGHPDILRAKTALWGGLERRNVKSTGFVVHTLEASLWACANSPDFERAVTLAANLGGDADTTACVTGAIAGAKFGAEAIPARWLEPLAQRHRIGALALSLVRSSSEIYLHVA
ncbi:ADP-ribosylglycohydrolase family protein [Lichenibacterium minor]|uniref:ADP-ribosylglycohydrolase family protein n=2 Tax=Lichenibacterium minor TaxID=2316528 RepID=A0A4Q2UBB8_9HYPH|nr:ADP-ribosylglycohydrolase family protein [Lichenibacterium minor]